MEKKVESCLQNEIVYVKPVEENVASWIPKDKNGHVRVEGTEVSYDVPLTARGLYQVITQNEQEFLEKNIDRTRPTGWMSTSNVKDNVWKGRNRYKVTLGLEPVKLDLSIGTDYVKYKILLANKEDIAPSFAQRTDRKYYFYIDKQSELDKHEANQVDKKTKAVTHYVIIAKDVDKLRDFLLVVHRGNERLVPKDMVLNTAKRMAYELIETDVNKYLSVIEDEMFQYKVFIYKLLQVGAVVRNGYEYRLGYSNGTLIGNSMSEVLEYVKDLKTNPNKQQEFLKLKEKIQ